MLSVDFIHDLDYIVQGDVPSAQIPNANSTKLRRLTAMPHQTNPYVQSFVVFRELVTSAYAPVSCFIVIHSDRLPTCEHIRR